MECVAALARPQYNPVKHEFLGKQGGFNMALTVKKIALWRKEVENGVGILAGALAPLAHAGANIHVVMAYRDPGQKSKGAIELYPVTGKKSAIAAKEAGFSASDIPALLVEGDNRAGLGYATAQAIADAGISLDFLRPALSRRQTCQLAALPLLAPVRQIRPVQTLPPK